MSAAIAEVLPDTPGSDATDFAEAYWNIVTATGRRTETPIENAIRWMLVESAVYGTWEPPHALTLARLAAQQGPGMPEDPADAREAAEQGRALLVDGLADLPFNAGSVPAAMLTYVRAIRRTRSAAKARPIWEWEDPETAWVQAVIEAVEGDLAGTVSWETLTAWIGGDSEAHTPRALTVVPALPSEPESVQEALFEDEWPVDEEPLHESVQEATSVADEAPAAPAVVVKTSPATVVHHGRSVIDFDDISI